MRHMGLNQVIRCLPLDVHKHLASVDETEGGDTEFIMQEVVSSLLREDLEEIFKERKEQHKDSHC